MQVKKLKSYLVAGALLLGAFLAVGRLAQASVPSNGATIQQRKQPVDGTGVAFGEQQFLGYKIFVATSTTAIQLVDETGTVQTCGMVHSIWVSSGTAATEFAVVYDSQPAPGASNLSQTVANEQWQIAPVINRLTSGPTSNVIDAQFNNGVVVLQSAGTTAGGTTHVYWRPCRGGAQ